jgi:hypothetical protein
MLVMTRVAPEKSKFRFFHRTRRSKPTDDHVGQLASVQTFYENPYKDDEDDEPVWVEWAAPSLPAPKKMKFEGAAIQVYRGLIEESKVGASHSERYYTQKIRIQSPLIRAALQDSFKQQGLAEDSNGLLESRGRLHRPLFFCREKIAEVAKTAEDPLTRSHCEILCEVIEQNLSSALDAGEQYEKEQTISYDKLWILFPRGSIFATEIGGYVRAFRVELCGYKPPRFMVDCTFIAFDGSRYGTSKHKLEFSHFVGHVHVSKLPDYPFIDLSKNPTTRDRLLLRGRELLEFQIPRYMGHLRPRGEDKKNVKLESTSFNVSKTKFLRCLRACR